MATAKNARGNKWHHETDGEQRSRAGRVIWAGSISFGLLQIPVSIHVAEEKGEEIHFRQLDKNDLQPIRYERVNAKTGKPVEWNDIVKGYELEKGSYVVVDSKDLAKANVKATQTIDIQDFVLGEEIEPAFFETPYFLIPQARATKAYVLLREALTKKKAVAIATFVLRTREHLVAVMPVGDALMLEVLRFAHELKTSKDMSMPKGASISARERAMAEQLIHGMMTDWAPRKYKDHFYGDVMKLIEEKAKSGKVLAHNPLSKAKAATDVVDLLALLKASVANGRKTEKAANDSKTSTTTKTSRKKKAA